jgi:hypothetical protein
MVQIITGLINISGFDIKAFFHSSCPALQNLTPALIDFCRHLSEMGFF